MLPSLYTYTHLVNSWTKTHPTASSVLHVIAINVPGRNMCSTLHICGLFFVGAYGRWMCICATFEVSDINHLTRKTVHIPHIFHFILFAYHLIWQPLYKYRSNCPWSVLAYISNVDVYMWQNTTNCNIYFTRYYHTCASNKYAQQVAHMYHNLVDIYEGWMCKNVPHKKSLASAIWPAVLYS